MTDSATARVRYFSTDSLPLAAFLYAHGLWLSRAESEARGKYLFVFRETVDCSRLVWQFHHAPNAIIDARTFVYALDELRDRASRVRRGVNYDD